MNTATLSTLAQNNNKKSILVVDDYLPTRNLVVEALEQSGNYEISEAADGTEALQLFKRRPYDMVISDVMMPIMGGMELLETIREMKTSTAVIMITAHPAPELTVTAMKQGAVDFLKKPFNIDELLFKVNLYLHDSELGRCSEEENESRDLQAKKEQLSLQSYIYDEIERADGNQEEIFQTVVELALQIVEGESCALYLYDEKSREFYPQVARSNNGAVRQNDVPFVAGIFNEVVAKRSALMINSDSDPLIAPSLICAPLMIRDNVLGVLSVRKKRGLGVFTKNELHNVSSLSKRASLNLENKVLYESVYANLLDTFKSLVASVQMRDHYTEQHCQRVADLSVRLARECNCSPGDIESLRIAAAIHDVGKIAWPDSILLKADRLSDEEYLIVKNHPRVGERILRPVLLLDREKEITLCHHERWDGKGYPAGLSGPQIPFLARIVAIADSFDAMTNNRPYRKARGYEVAIEEVKNNRNTQFDGDIVDVFINRILVNQ